MMIQYIDVFSHAHIYICIDGLCGCPVMAVLLVSVIRVPRHTLNPRVAAIQCVSIIFCVQGTDLGWLGVASRKWIL